MNDNKQKILVRNAHGLIDGVNYIFTDDGLINWRAMIPADFLYVNPDLKRRDKLEKKYGQPYDKIHPLLDNVEDVDLVMTLAGTKYLLKLRGYEYVNSNIHSSNESYAAVNCQIKFIPNYESEGRSIEYAENACAHPGNTNGFGQRYLLEMATNRALVRCVRNFLNINIVSKEELGGNNIPEEETKTNVMNPIKVLENLLNERNLNFELVKEKFSKPTDQWHSLSDISKVRAFEIIGQLKQQTR